MPALARATEPLSAPLSGAGEETGADPEDDLHNDLIPRQPEDEPAGDDDLPTHPPFNHYVQGYDRTDGTQSAPPSIEGEGTKSGATQPRGRSKRILFRPLRARNPDKALRL